MTAESHFCSQLYMYLIRQHLFDHLCTLEADSIHARSAKEMALSGSRDLLLSITKFMSDEDGECSFTREGWQCDNANNVRDFGFWLADITYGLVLSDRRVLDDVNTQMVVLPVVMGQDVRRMSYWHIRGTR
ncbi:uncharacterized protein N7518_007056 [Penicillium psychrosexuale]|uniref:uncharacterized protein n=1 Tax=Penicillium psychrosexuale TaxID=1002107 RepID=UPI0025452230|nr:uncharacterized protein N7518_007056 [Penicillium psychrosexuale]KAJ5790045.1 hypothetical protein N7518_007056 [Penicillium psychrosexuale]